MWVSPFRYLRIYGYLLLPAAFRSLSRLSSALSAKASALCSFLLDLSHLYSVINEPFMVSHGLSLPHALRHRHSFQALSFSRIF